ncbi:M48 family metalloprotease [Streptomyces sp. NBC_01525]|uniref:M48 family metalloprotease n=1 Tax=Streptomyces sp. NBC_01525 TaxID=2903893 RepID=UPI00386C43F1
MVWSIRHGTRAHLWIGRHWFHPHHTHHLAAVLEHELAHVRRRDTLTQRVAETAALVACALAAGLLSIPAFALTALCAWMTTMVFNWWSELPCDVAAVQARGRTPPVADMWSADIANERAPDPSPHVPGNSSTAFPPRTWAAGSPAAPVRLSADPHPLLATPPFAADQVR